MSDARRTRPYASLAVPDEDRVDRARGFFEQMDARRSVREFSDRPVPRELIEWAIRTASTAPSGAHKQPWTWAVISSAELKAKIREAAEQEEKAFYNGRASDEWLEALAPLGTDWEKPFLTTAPWIVVLFAQRFGVKEDGSREKFYYVQESVGIAAGLFIAALHQMGLATLTHTPSPMGFLRDVLGRPSNEAATILFPVGFPAESAEVPVLERKPLADVSVWFED
ncbi:nitroreductase family protein [Rubricoccus marinus]|uniref:Nitroreductase family protein n=1 Tax=Rubricoccus marinus TaxID=716817 RepID=A0A259TZ51_9BACT|nr:nitroreductase family protein [Rubricoccus marinus]OZC03055.1 nitroreductase family protein [Rubricoccus marinus]